MIVWSQFTAPHQHRFGGTVQRFWRPTCFDYSPGALDVPTINPGQFVQLVPSSYGAADVARHDGTGNLGILDWNPATVYDPNTDQILTAGCRRRTKVVAYSNKTGRWREVTQPRTDYIGTAHWYGGTAFDGHVCMWHRWLYDPMASDWEDFGTVHSFNAAITGSMVWWPEYGHSGAWFNSSDGKFTLWDKMAGMQVSLGDSGHGKHCTAIRHPLTGRILVVGGTDTGNYATLIETGGSFARVADIPNDYLMSSMPLFFYPDAEAFLTLSSDDLSTASMISYWPAANVWKPEGRYAGAAGGVNKYDTYAYDEKRKLFYVHRTQGIFAHKIKTLVAP